MSDKMLRYMVAIVIAMLLIFQIGTLISGLFGMVWGAAAAIIVAVVSFFTTRLAKASGKGSFWFLLPTILFTVVPIALAIWEMFTAETSWLDRVTNMIPFIVGFGAPVALLFIVYFELRSRTV